MSTAHSFAWKKTFLDHLAKERGNVRRAAELAGVSKTAVYARASRDATFGRELREVLKTFPYRRGRRRPASVETPVE